jgi:hypothetical protein
MRTTETGTRTWHIMRCDGQGCGTIVRARQECDLGWKAAASRWRTVEGRDLCPSCYSLFLAGQRRAMLARWRAARRDKAAQQEGRRQDNMVLAERLRVAHAEGFTWAQVAEGYGISESKARRVARMHAAPEQAAGAGETR